MSPFDSNSDALTTLFSNYTNNTNNIELKFDKKVIKILQEDISFTWIIFGSVGNLLSFIILCSKKMRIHSTFTYLTLLAICDFGVLFFGQLRDYLVNKYQINVEGQFWCKFHVFIFYFMLHMASWLLVAVNFDRLIAATFLALSKKFCTPQMALKVSATLALCLCLLNGHFLYFVESPESNTQLRLEEEIINNKPNLSKNSTKNYVGTTIETPINPYVYPKCLIKANSPKYVFFFQSIFTWIDAGAQVILPFLIMVVCNIVIIYKVLLNKNKSNGKNVKRLRKIKGMCIMIVSVSVIFFVLEAPVLIFICFGIEQSEWAHTELLWTIINLMMYTNHVINFISYCMTGTKFRRELLHLLNCHKFLKSVNLFFTKIPEPTNTRFNNFTTGHQIVMNSHFDIEMKEIHKRPHSSSVKNNSLTTRIMNKKNKLLSIELSPNNEDPNKTIGTLVINNFELKHLRKRSLDLSESCSSIGSSFNSQPILSRFKYN